ncbi:coiled-coil domain-containing protein 174 [Drosophila innubila]|uniref:coiled-coil domain-containing protein 174 n=1 Tax=Drosophila innubila TaxID=198719 RepID=UPI00148E6312|nr:coiled-coil domain-containing protein 174 [Drosophila innubila]
MNDPNKAISVNLSSLLSLKAELQRKQHEVKLAKATKTSAHEFKPNKVASEREKEKSRPSSSKNSNYTEISRSDDVKVYEAEDYAQLDKSRRVLEAKSKFYDRMSRTGGSLNSDDNCLVMFNRKRQEQQFDQEQEPQISAQRERLISSSSSSSDSTVDAGNDDDEVEYVDCLGRTRKCLRKELEEAKRRDKQLADSMPERLDQSKANWMIDTKGNTGSNHNSDEDEPIYGPRATESVFSEALSTMTKHDEQRINWERKELENFDKPDVHYQDVFFDEARTHGVGYYAFSTDEAERKQQQRELEQSRKATQAEQKRRDELRAQRDRIVADRVLAAKNRIRARNGLPPITKEDYEREQQLKAAEATAESAARQREQNEKDEKLAAQKAAEDAEREELRKEHIRDWDRDKSGVPKKHDDGEQAPEEWQYKAERLPMSQEQWNEQQRAVRAPEFAPMPEVMLKRTNFSSSTPSSSMWQNKEFNSFHSTKREKQFQRRNYTKATDDLQHEDGEENEESATSSEHSRRYGAAIPPPDSLDSSYSGSSIPKRPKTQDELERSISAGLKFLRDNCDKGVLGNKGTWTAKADY